MNIHTTTLSAEARKRLRAFKREVERALPGGIVEMRLFGSRARGDAKEDSDYDIAVLIHPSLDSWDALPILSDAAYPHVLEGYYFRPISLPEGYLEGPSAFRTELADEIVRDGIVLT